MLFAAKCLPALLLLPAVQGGEVASHPIELRSSPLVELWLEVRLLSESSGLPEDEDWAAAVEAMRALGGSLGRDMGFGPVEGNLVGVADAEELALAFEELPETLRSRGGAEVAFRRPCIEAAVAVAAIEERWWDEQWPAREEALAAAKARLEVTLEDKGAAIYARLHRTLGLRVREVEIPVYLVTAAPWPGAFTHRRYGGGGVSFVALEDELSDLVEEVVHETIHALDIATPGPESLLVELRQGLAAANIEAQDAHDWVHTLFFLEAGSCVRALIDPDHIDYGDRTTLYARSRPAVDVERPLWEAWTTGELEREQLVSAIVADARKLIDEMRMRRTP